jgi:hypothetical protein
MANPLGPYSPIPITVVSGTTEIIAAATGVLTAAQVNGTVINNYGQTAANTQTLPPAATGLGGAVVIATSGMGAFNLKPATGDIIWLSGTALSANHKVSFGTPAVGNFFTFFSFKTGTSTWAWLVMLISGTLTDGGA